MEDNSARHTTPHTAHAFTLALLCFALLFFSLLPFPNGPSLGSNVALLPCVRGSSAFPTLASHFSLLTFCALHRLSARSLSLDPSSSVFRASSIVPRSSTRQPSKRAPWTPRTPRAEPPMRVSCLVSRRLPFVVRASEARSGAEWRREERRGDADLPCTNTLECVYVRWLTIPRHCEDTVLQEYGHQYISTSVHAPCALHANTRVALL